MEKGANKTQIKAAVEEIFEVKVKAVTTSRKEGKLKRQGRTEGRRPETKKAYVTLTEESKTIGILRKHGTVSAAGRLLIYGY